MSVDDALTVGFLLGFGTSFAIYVICLWLSRR